jgi:hypothetical protein
VLGLERFADLRHVPTRQVGLDAVHEGGIVAHLGRQLAKQMADAPLVLDIEIAHQDDAAIGANALFAATELA